MMNRVDGGGCGGRLTLQIIGEEGGGGGARASRSSSERTMNRVDGGGGGGGDRRTRELIRQAVRALPRPPDLRVVLDGTEDDKQDPVALSLFYRGIDPDNRFDPCFDFLMLHRPDTEQQLKAWMKSPLKLHDAGLLKAMNTVINWGPGPMKGCYDFSSDISHAMEIHPGPISCLRVDCSALPASQRLERWIEVLTVKEVQELILLNLTEPEGTEAPLHRLRSRRLKYLGIGFLNIRACLRLAMEAAELDGHAWSQFNELTLIACAFDGQDLARTVNGLLGLKNLSIGYCSLTEGCSEDGLCITSIGLATLRLWSCTADRMLTFGDAPALTELTLGVVPTFKDTSTSSLQIRIEIKFCVNLRVIDDLDMAQHCMYLWTDYTRMFRQCRTLAMRFLHTLGVAVEMATAHHVMSFISLLQWFPHLRDLTLRCIDDNNDDDKDNDKSHSNHVCPSVDSACCLVNSLHRLNMQQFKSGSVEITFVTAVLAIARFLTSVTVNLHQKTRMQRQDVINLLKSCPRVALECDVVVVSPPKGQV